VRVADQDGVKYEGKRVTMAPFALIWLSADGKSAKTVLSEYEKLAHYWLSEHWTIQPCGGLRHR